MKHHDMTHLRNIGIMAHIDAGKTTTTERMLYYTGLTHKIGEVHNGNTVMDWMIQEQERGITITSAATTCHWQDYRINIIDTPGHVDFTVEVERCLRILDGAVFVLDAKEGVEAQTHVVWHQADHYQVPRLVYVNKMDTIGADFDHSVKTLHTDLNAKAVAIHMPMGSEKEFEGIISLITMKAYFNLGKYGERLETCDIPLAYREEAAERRRDFIETLAGADDDLMMLYLEDEDLTENDILQALRRVTINGSITPVLCGASFKNKGVQMLLDAIVDFLPSPLDRPLIEGMDTAGNAVHRSPSEEAPFSALIFKLMSDPYVGRLAFIRIYSGTLKAGASIQNVSQGKKVRPNKLLQMHANSRTELDHTTAGDIVAVVGLKFAATGNTLADISHPILLESIDFPDPVISRSLEPKKPGDSDKLIEALSTLSQEDPTLTTDLNEETGQTIISGMGELHLEIVLDRLSKEFGISVNSGNPRVTHKEAITKEVTVPYTLPQSTGSQSPYAFIELTAAPRERGTGHSIRSDEISPKVPKAFVEAAEEGIRRSLASGILMGYEVIDLSVTIKRIDFNEDQSTEVGFMTAGAFALNEALKLGASVLLEPYFTVNIHAPEAYIGDVMEDIKRRKGSITAMEILPKSHKIVAIVPLSLMFGYATDIRSITRGHGHYTMLFDHYDILAEGSSG